MEEIKWIIIKKSNAPYSYFNFSGDFEINWDLELWNGGEKITKFDDVNSTNTQAKIIIKIDKNVGVYQQDYERNLELYLKESTYDKIIGERKVEVSKAKQGELEQAWNEACLKVFEKKFAGDVNSSEELTKGVDGMSYTIYPSAGGGYYLKIKGRGSGEERNVDQVKLEPEFYIKKKIRIKDLIQEVDSSKEKGKSSRKLIIWLVIIALLVLPLIIFRKKIWRWFKGETKQEKKVREQIDIF